MGLTSEDRERLQELLEEVSPLLDDMVDICRQDAFLEAYVPGNLWAERYGYMGKAALDYVEDYLQEHKDDVDDENPGLTLVCECGQEIVLLQLETMREEMISYANTTAKCCASPNYREAVAGGDTNG